MKKIHPVWFGLPVLLCVAVVAVCLTTHRSKLAGSNPFPRTSHEEITADAASSPQDHPSLAASEAFHELKLFDQDGRPWRSATEDWTGARERVNNDPAWGAWLQVERADVDAWIKRFPTDHVEWACGYYHAFVSPKDGSTLTWTPEIPDKEAHHFSSATDPFVKITPTLAEAWVYGFRTRHADMIRRAAWLYRLTSDERYAAWASSQLDYYAAHYAQWRSRPQNLGAHLTWQPLDEANLCISYAEAVRVLDRYAEPKRLSAWRHGLFQPIVGVLNRNYLQIHNIGLWCRAASAEVALVFHNDAAWHEALDGPYGVRAQFAQGVTADYLWHEQSFGYNSFVITAAKQLFTVAGLYGRAAELSREMNICENLMLAPIDVRFPDGRLPHPADDTGWSMKPSPDPALFRSTYRVFPTALGLAEADKPGAGGWDTLLDPPSAIAEDAPTVLPEVASSNLRATRMAVLRSGAWQVFFHYGQLTKSHAKLEALNYEASYGLVDITHNTGVVGYMSPMNAWFRSSVNYNVPLIDGKGEDEPARGDLITYSAETSRVSASQVYGGGGRAVRTLEISGDQLIDTVTVTTHAAKAEKLSLALHLQGRIRSGASFAPDPTFAKRGGPYAYWRRVKVAVFRDEAAFDVDYGSVIMHVTLATPGIFRVWTGSTPDQPDTTSGQRDGLYLELQNPANHAVFTTTFSPAVPPADRDPAEKFLTRLPSASPAARPLRSHTF